MNDAFYLASVSHLMTNEYARVMKNAGVSEADWKLVSQDKLWSQSDRIRTNRIIDALIYGSTEMAGMPKVDISAEMCAAILATVVSPMNWMIVASWQEGLAPAYDLATAESSVQIERISAGKMLALIGLARSALSSNAEWNEYRSRVNQKLTQQGPKAVSN